MQSPFATTSTTYARAKHSFCGKNNDELSFDVGDEIAITRQDEGGWWEGTLNGDTGWFPSAYVNIVDKMLRSRSVPHNGGVNLSSSTAISDESATVNFIKTVLENFLSAEKEYIFTLKKVVEDYFAPLSKSDILTADEFHTLEGRYSEIYALQANVFLEMKDSETAPLKEQRTGGNLLASAATLKDLLVAYCYNHPDAVLVLTLHHEALAEFFSQTGGNIRDFIQGLSEPFRHVGKYPAMLDELSRTIPESHADRGDVKRSSIVYRDLKELCEWSRHQREVQQQMISLPAMAALVEGSSALLYVGTAGTSKEGDEGTQDRTVCVSSSCLAVVEMRQDASDCSILHSLPIAALRATRIVAKHQLSIHSGAGEEFTFTFPSSFECERMVETLVKCGVHVALQATPSSRASTPRAVEVKRRQQKEENADEGTNALDASIVSQKLHSSFLRTKHNNSTRKAKSPMDESMGGFRVDHDLEMILPDSFDEEDAPRRSNDSTFYLRSNPPYRVQGNTGIASKKPFKMRKEMAEQQQMGEQADAALLSIIEGYLNVASQEGDDRLHSRAAPQLIVADAEKLLVEQVLDGHTIVTEKSLVDVVYALKDQMDQMVAEMSSLRAQLEKESKARRRLEDSVKRSSLHLHTSTPKPLSESSH